MLIAEFFVKLVEQDRAFFSQLEAASGQAFPEVSRPRLDLGSTMAFFAGEGSPLTQAIGDFQSAQINELAHFYRGRATSYEAVLRPMDGYEGINRLLDIDAKVEGWEEVLWRSTAAPLPDWTQPPEIEIRRIAESQDVKLWIDIGAKAFFGDSELPIARHLGHFLSHVPANKYLATWNGEPAAVATMNPGKEISFAGGMATLPEFRGKGLQMALIRRRIQDAPSPYLAVGAKPDGPSRRNQERAGFALAFSELHLRVPVPSGTL